MRRPTDDLIAPCATEGGTFREPVRAPRVPRERLTGETLYWAAGVMFAIWCGAAIVFV